MNAHIGEEVEFIISFQVSYEALTFRTVIFQFKKCQRVLSGICILGIQPVRITIRQVTFFSVRNSLPETTKSIKHITIPIYRTGRIHRYSSTNSTTIGITVLSHHCLSIHIKLQIVVKERSSHIDTGSKTLEIRSFHDTFLIRIT